jgi:hypothetical protein
MGEGESLDYLKNLCFTHVYSEQASPCHFVNLSRILQRTRMGVACVEVNRLLAFAVPNNGLETYPWIRQKVFLKQDAWRERKRYIRGKLTRKVRKNQYHFVVVHDPKGLSTFYDAMYAPYIRHRYGAATHLRSFGEIRAAVEHGFMLQVFDGDLWVAGAVCGVRQREVVSLAVGLIPDYCTHLRRGALVAVYHFLLKWAEENNMNTVDLLRSRPHTEDGVFEHKRLWGAGTIKDCWPHTCIRLFLPQGMTVPSPLQGLLVWNGHEFVTAGQDPTD